MKKGWKLFWIYLVIGAVLYGVGYYGYKNWGWFGGTKSMGNLLNQNGYGPPPPPPTESNA